VEVTVQKLQVDLKLPAGNRIAIPEALLIMTVLSDDSVIAEHQQTTPQNTTEEPVQARMTSSRIENRLEGLGRHQIKLGAAIRKSSACPVAVEKYGAALLGPWPHSRRKLPLQEKSLNAARKQPMLRRDLSGAFRESSGTCAPYPDSISARGSAIAPCPPAHFGKSAHPSGCNPAFTLVA
jgi:hypothetical protein